ncbi:MAG: RidA family protein [Xanthobacteraceae bacterium]|nr:MAG: RidA family protein [Xanthobacteraceae bacterium]
MHKVLQPDGWARPLGYANGMEAAKGRVIYVAGQVGWTPDSKIVSDDLALQVRQALQNIVDIVAVAGGKPEHLTALTWFITDTEEYNSKLKPIGAAYREVIGRHFPTMSVIGISKLIEEGAKVEIVATAVIPE